MKKTITLIVTILLSIFLLSCKKEEIKPVDPYFYIDPELQDYFDAYIAECEEFGTPYEIPVSFTMILSDSIGVANNLGAEVVLRYSSQPGKVRMLVSDEMYSWSEKSRRYVNFHGLGHALRSLEHQSASLGIDRKSVV